MNDQPSTHPSTAPIPPGKLSPPPLMTQLMLFAAVAISVGGALLALSTIVTPGGPFLVAALLFGLALPAVLLTYRHQGAVGVRELLRDCVRLPRRWWWLAIAAFGIPVTAWMTGAAIGGARPLTGDLVEFYVLDLIIGALVINIWEEMAWTGYFQRRASSLWGAVGGSLVTSLFFTGIHLPLAFDGAPGAGEVATNVMLIAGVATGLRLVIARIDPWCGRSLLTIGVLHSSFNATETLLDPTFDWVRIVVTITAGICMIAVGKDSPEDAFDSSPRADRGQ